MNTSFSRRVVVALALLAPAAVLCLAACRGGNPVGEVSGKVTFKGKAVAEGRVSFRSPAGAGDEALLNANGTFELKTPLPVGEYRVTVMPLVVRQKDDPKGPEVGVEKPAPDIPTKYRTEGPANDLRAIVKEGKNDFHFDLKP